MTTVQPFAAGELAGTSAEWTARYQHAVMNTFGTPKAVLVRGEGPYVWDADGTRYLDLLGGIAVNVLGHAHPTLTAAISAQLGTLGQVSNFFASPPQVALAERLIALAGGGPASRVFFANSGTEANEAAFKMARRTGRTRMLALEGAFHGRTMGALALTAKAAYREPFEPLPGDVQFLPFGDTAALEAALTDDVAALVVEVVQGEAGVRPLPPGYLAHARRLADEVGALLVVDEVQTGIGRTGRWFAFHDPELGGGVLPDVVTLAKGLGGGIPVGAVLALTERAAGLLGPGQHGTTFGGNPVATAAALATLGVIERDGLLANVRQVSGRLVEALVAVPLVREVRAAGLLVAIELGGPVAAEVAERALAAGFIVNPVTPTALRLAPPLVVTWEQVATFVDFLAGLPADVASPTPSREAR
ncbi:acetylornithine transaminase [Actinotalea fermentans]|uniref:Acetylornithine aminotransferase n=1 Tax=Actinotalea fermentans TaxID=43671 RepID=A0A511YVG3_9CELL|nr:acetylornithine transaminase [Actinotalea fermentans]KGM16433.1 acetylornithine aminotransferase [Actinotalea fermentans ATCC 43279 = JCM 9966 = DSM 3133]GEN79192.1 acetylornithine aminotransferase [Actinotalea fermentans]